MILANILQTPIDHGNIIQILLENGADVKALGDSFDSALRAAIENRWYKVEELLLAHKNNGRDEAKKSEQ